jgi:YHS domain-containing protein
MKNSVSYRSLASMACVAAVAVAFSVAAAAPALAADDSSQSTATASPAPSSPAMSPMPAATPKGEFDNSCAMGLAEGQKVATNCSVNWTADDGKVYCFSTEDSKAAFLKNPTENIQKAREFQMAQTNGGPSGPPAADLTEDDVKAAVQRVVDERSKDGAFVYRDPKLNADLHLVMEQVNIMRRMGDYGWFATVMFHDKDEAKKQYELDFWFKRKAPVQLMDIRVRRAPMQEGEGYTLVTRQPVAWWWLPASDHPGDLEVTKAWQVMGAIHNYIATHKDDKGDLVIKDDVTGENVPLEFVEIHQPVRHLKKDGKFFVCTDFRKPGSDDEFYDIDFWVNRTSGKLEVSDVKIHKVPVQEDGVWTEKARYTFDGLDFDEAK